MPELPAWFTEVSTAAFPFLAGWLAGSAAKKWWLTSVHDSVLRRAHLDGDWSAVSMRKNFCAIVNDKSKLVDFNGEELPGWKFNVRRTLSLTLFTLFIVAGIAMAYSGLPDEADAAVWKLSSPFPALVAWLYFGITLKRTTVRAKFIRRLSTKPDKWETTILKGKRAEDGIPTLNAGIEA